MFLDAARVAPEKAVLRPALPMFLWPGWIGTNMGKLTYREQLMHPNWQRKRLEVMEAARFGCERCGATEQTLNVHHKRYVKGRMAWDYERAELECLCQPCHEQRHDTRDLLERLLMQADMTDELAIGLIGGYLDAACGLDEALYMECLKVAGDAVISGAIAEIMRPNLHVKWDQIADGVTAMYAKSVLNPAEANALDLARLMSGGQPFDPSKEQSSDA